MIQASSGHLQPDFLCIGSPKAGTTWLHGNLRLHPKVAFTPVKEIHYFDRSYFKGTRSFIEKAQLRKIMKGLKAKIKGEKVDDELLKFLVNMYLTETKDDNWYLSLFQDIDPECVIGDMTPLYCAIPDAGVKHIKNLLGDVKIIFLMRNPVKRAWSNVLMGKRNAIKKGEKVSDQEWLNLLTQPVHKKRGDYQRTIANYEQYFDKDKILYLFYDQICLDPLGFLNQVCDFLDIEYKQQYFEENITEYYNKNPKTVIPEAVKEFLTKECQEQTEWVQAKFNPSSFEL